MDITNYWERALAQTEVVRPRIRPLSVSEETQLDYIFLAQSAVNPGTTVVRKGMVVVEKPAIVLPPHMPLFEGFEWEKESHMVDFLMIRGIHFPSMKYKNNVRYLDIYEGDLAQARAHYLRRLQREEDVNSGLVMGPEDCWQCSVLIFVAMMASKSAERDVQALLKEFWDKA